MNRCKLESFGDILVGKTFKYNLGKVVKIADSYVVSSALNHIYNAFDLDAHELIFVPRSTLVKCEEDECYEIPCDYDCEYEGFAPIDDEIMFDIQGQQEPAQEQQKQEEKTVRWY